MISVHCFPVYRIIDFRGVLVSLLGGASYRSPHVHIWRLSPLFTISLYASTYLLTVEYVPIHIARI